jgi:membrane dipeptidase
MLASFRRWFSARPDKYVLARSVADIDRARAEKKLAILFDIEGMGPLDDGDDGLVQLFYDLGVKWMLVAYNRNTAAGGGCADEDRGLTDYGRRLLAEMKRVGMVVCCSHTGHRTALEVMEHAGNPVIFSHSNPSAVHAHYRNIPDELIKVCAATGGVVGINGIGIFLGENDDRPETIVRHIDHVAQLVGPDHVGISLDYVFDQEALQRAIKEKPEIFPNMPALGEEGLRLAGPEVYPAVADGLLRRGYGVADVKKILGGNWRRVAEQVWR